MSGKDHLPDGEAQTVSGPLGNLAAVIPATCDLVQVKNNQGFFEGVEGQGLEGQGLDPGCYKVT